jgi:hypothetical protein
MTLAPARTIDWDTVGQLVKNNILQALTGDDQFMAFANECEQCFHACKILRIGRIPTVPYSVIGRLLSLDKGLVRRQFKWGLAHPHGPGQNGRPPLLSPQHKDQLFEAILMVYINQIP